MTTATRLTALDSGFLLAESPTTPLHVGSLSIFEGAPLRDEDGRIRIDEIMRLTAERLDVVPRFRQRLVDVPFGLGRPMWVDDPEFDISHHVRLVALPAPGDERQLRELCASLHTELLDRSRPLWEMWFVDGLSGGRVALIEKIHHAMVDGVSSVDIAMALLDLDPAPAHHEPAVWAPDPLPGRTRTFAGAVAELALEPLRLTTSAIGALRHPRRTLDRARHLAGSFASVGRDALAPRSSLNTPIGGRDRRYEVVTLPLRDVRDVKTRAGVTLNDVVLASVAGGLRQLLLDRGELVDGRTLHAMVPVSLRGDGDHLTLGNRVGTIIAPLPVGEADPHVRLRTVHDAMAQRKACGQADASAALVGLSDHLPPPVMGVVARSVHHQPLINVVVTNVPGPPVPLYLLGARMLETFPVVPVGGNLDVSIGIVSYDQQLTIGLLADSVTCADVATLAEGIEKSFAELREAS
jgi:WS/DGAT/MGAT family acyltransferase